MIIRSRVEDGYPIDRHPEKATLSETVCMRPWTKTVVSMADELRRSIWSRCHVPFRLDSRSYERAGSVCDGSVTQSWNHADEIAGGFSVSGLRACDGQGFISRADRG